MIKCSAPRPSTKINPDFVKNQKGALAVFQHKYQNKRTIKNFNFMEMVINGKSKTMKIGSEFSEYKPDHERNRLLQSEQLSGVNPEIPLIKMDKDNGKRQKNCDQFGLGRYSWNISTDYHFRQQNAFPDRWIKRAKDPKWHNYANMREQHSERVLKKSGNFEQMMEKSQKWIKQKSKTASKSVQRTVYMKEVEENSGRYYRTMQYRSPKFSIKKNSREQQSRSQEPKGSGISPWAISIQNLDQGYQ